MSELPVRIYFRANSEANSYSLINQADDKWLLALLVNGEHTIARQAEILEEMQRRWNSHDDMVAVLRELAESASYWSEYDVPLGIVDRINAAIANATGSQP
jgi:hypothetical protein